MNGGARFFELDRTLIDPPTANPRWEPRELDDLVESIRGVGILEPLICVAAGATGRVRLVAGLRRYTAAGIVGLEKVPTIVHPYLTEQQELAIGLVENLHRKNLSPVERGEAFRELTAAGISRRQVARMCGLSDMTVSIGLDIATKLIPEARHACHIGELTQSQAWQLATMPEPLQRAVYLGERGTARVRDQKNPRSRAPYEEALRQAVRCIGIGNRQAALDLARQAVELLEQAVADDGNDDARIAS